MIVDTIKSLVSKSINNLYNQTFQENIFQINLTKPEFEGDYTVVLFSLIKSLKTNPDALGDALGNHLTTTYPELFTGFTLIKGFLNLTIADEYWINFLTSHYDNVQFGKLPFTGKKVMVEYSSPNTNKPLHLGHLRNNFLGWSISEILKANGNEVIKSCVVNDRGIHICKSMIAWLNYGNGSTPNTAKQKGDHFVGDYYVKFNDIYKQEVEQLIVSGISKVIAEKEAPIMKAAQQMLIDWEAGKLEVISVWEQMNHWVYDGFEKTYNRIGTDFDKVYYESSTYLLGKKMVEEGLGKGVFTQKSDNSVWIDLTNDGLDEKIVQRKDGTAVYITQDIGLAVEKYNDFNCEESIYVVGDEQNYHFKVLKLICEKMSVPAAKGIYHLSYGMVELPTGKMKSREGTVVDADDLVDEMVKISASHTEALGKVKDFNEDELAELYETIGIGALKFFLLRVDPKKKMIFNPEESIDFHGFTGPFIQYTHARIRSILRKEHPSSDKFECFSLLPLEKELLVLIEQFRETINQSATEQNPSLIAIYVFNLAKVYNSFYAELSVNNAESEEKKQLRLRLSLMTANILKSGMELLGIKVPSRM
jgi:arginyl-tRNA synthetase